MDSPQSSRILSVSRDFSLSTTRERILISAGYAVISTLSTEEALKCLRKGLFDLVIVGHTVLEDDRRFFISHIRALDPTLPVLFVSTIAGEEVEPHADFSSSSMPEDLLRQAKKALALPRTPARSQII